MSSREKPIWKKILLMLIWSFVAFVILMVGEAIGGKTYRIWDFFAANKISDDLGLIETTLVYFTFIGIEILFYIVMSCVKSFRPILKAVGRKNKGNNLKMLLLGCGIGLGTNGICALVALIKGDIQLSFYNFSIGAFLILLISVTIQCAAEEYICRGFLLQMTAKYFENPLVIIVFNSIIFSLLHSDNKGSGLVAMIQLLAFGLLMSLMVYYFDSLWAAIGIHTAWNFNLSIILGLPNSGLVFPYSFFKLDAANARDSFCFNTQFGIEGSILAVIVEIIAIAITWYLGIKRQGKMIDIWEDAVEAKNETGQESLEV